MIVNKKMLIKILFVLSLTFVWALNTYTVKAAGMSLSEMESQAGNFINKGQEAANGKIDAGEIAENFVEIGKILTLVGAGVMVAVTTYMGIKYLTSGPEAQAKLKVQLIGVVVSGVVIFGAFGIWSIVVDIVSKF